jgi:DNA-binding response OmpR family regulator
MEDARRILLVEDEHLIMKWWEKMLSEEGYKVITASDGREGFDLAIREVPDLIVSDVEMPVMDGRKMASKLGESIHTNRIPIIFLTSLISEDESGQQLINKNLCISKLSKPTELLCAIRNLLALRSASSPRD